MAWQVVFVPPQEIDEKNILWATMDRYGPGGGRAEHPPGVCARRRQPLPRGAGHSGAGVVKGDANSASIAAASILAKVSRDRYMQELDKQYPQYQLARHKGYPTALHYQLLEQYGIQPFYRRSFLKKQGYRHGK